MAKKTYQYMEKLNNSTPHHLSLLEELDSYYGLRNYAEIRPEKRG